MGIPPPPKSRVGCDLRPRNFRKNFATCDLDFLNFLCNFQNFSPNLRPRIFYCIFLNKFWKKCCDLRPIPLRPPSPDRGRGGACPYMLNTAFGQKIGLCAFHVKKINAQSLFFRITLFQNQFTKFFLNFVQ